MADDQPATDDLDQPVTKGEVAEAIAHMGRECNAALQQIRERLSAIESRIGD